MKMRHCAETVMEKTIAVQVLKQSITGKSLLCRCMTFEIAFLPIGK